MSGGNKIKAPPLPPKVTIVATTTDSITVKLRPNSDDSTPIIGYKLFYKPESGEMEEIEVKNDVQKYTIENLLCGTRYQFHAKGYNRYCLNLIESKTKYVCKIYFEFHIFA